LDKTGLKKKFFRLLDKTGLTKKKSFMTIRFDFVVDRSQRGILVDAKEL